MQKCKIIEKFIYYLFAINLIINLTMALSIKTIRSNPNLVIESQIKRSKNSEIVIQLLDLDFSTRKLAKQIDNLGKEKNIKQKEISIYYKSKNTDCVEAKILSEQIDELTQQIIDLQNSKVQIELLISTLISQIGNIVADNVPLNENIIIKTSQIHSNLPNQLNHNLLLEKIGGLIIKEGIYFEGHKGYFLKDIGIKLNQAIINYSLDFLKTHFYTLIQIPSFIQKEPNTYINPICGFHANETLGNSKLPKRYAGLNTSFKNTTGAYGKSFPKGQTTWNINSLYRFHEINTIEQYAITEDLLVQSNLLQDEMLKITEEFYKSLNIPYRVLNIMSGKIENSAIRKYQLECWFPSSSKFKELGSCSNTTDYFSRQLNIKCAEKRFVHVVNSTLCDCAKLMNCLLELGQKEDGIELPEVLSKYMDGSTFIPWVLNN